MPYGFGRQLPIVPPSLNDLNLPPNPFNILATLTVVTHTQDENHDNYSPQSPEPSESSPISTPPMNVSAFNSWETSYTTTDDDTFYSDDEPRRIHFFAINSYFPLMEISFIFCLCFHLLCRRGNNHFDVHFWRIGPVLFPSKEGKDRPWKKKWTEGCLFPARVGIFSFINKIIKVLFPICTLIWRVNNYVYRQGKVKMGEIRIQFLL